MLKSVECVCHLCTASHGTVSIISRWKRKPNIIHVALGIVTSISVGAAVVCKEVKRMNAQFSHVKDVFEHEKRLRPYIYLDNDFLESEDLNEVKTSRKQQIKRIFYKGLQQLFKSPLFPWIQSHSNDPRTLLRLAQSNDHNVRLMGVKALAEQHHWNDAEFQFVAQACDMQTRIGLARSRTADPRLFLPQPKLQKSEEEVEDLLRQLLASLPVDHLDRCTKYFTSSALQSTKVPAEEREGVWTFDGDDLMRVQPPVEPQIGDQRALSYCLEALFSHSCVPGHCHEIVNHGGLHLLQRVYENRPHSIKLLRNIARVLANLAYYENLHTDIVQGGWISVLAKWLKSPDLALSLHAGRALANLDRDYGFGEKKYPDGIYLYHPVHRYSEPVYADIIFVHGLLGGPFRTWRQRDPTTATLQADKTSAVDKTSQTDKTTPTDKKLPGNTNLQGQKNNYSTGNLAVRDSSYTFCWPKDWLAKDCPHVRILTVEYETHLSEWSPKCPFESEKRSLAMRSNDIIKKLVAAGIGERPVIWVGHSMGGLLIKQMLVNCHDNPDLSKIVKQTQGLIFYSVPHYGSALAAYSNLTKFLLYPSVEVQELKLGSSKLKQLHKSFCELMFEEGIPLLSFAEGSKSQLPLNAKMMIVPLESSDPGFGEYHLMEDMNHLDICKPVSRGSRLYRLTLDFIWDCIPMNIVENILRANLAEDFVLPDIEPEAES